MSGAKYLLSQEELNELIAYLLGSCKSVDEALNDITEGKVESAYEVDNEDEMYSQIDQVTFECVQCGWWCEAGDYAEVQDNPCGDICTDCGPEEN